MIFPVHRGCLAIACPRSSWHYSHCPCFSTSGYDKIRPPERRPPEHLDGLGVFPLSLEHCRSCCIRRGSGRCSGHEFLTHRAGTAYRTVAVHPSQLFQHDFKCLFFIELDNTESPCSAWMGQLSDCVVLFNSVCNAPARDSQTNHRRTMRCTRSTA